MLSTEDYIRGHKALSDLRVKYSGNWEGHTISRATLFEVKTILADIGLDRDRLVSSSLRWLGEHVSGLEVYEKIMGRLYTEEEKRRLTKEIELVSRLPCPGPHLAILCGVPGDLRSYVATEINNALDFLHLGYLRWGFLPAMIAAELAPEGLRELVRQGKVSDAKIGTVTLSGMMDKELVS